MLAQADAPLGSCQKLVIVILRRSSTVFDADDQPHERLSAMNQFLYLDNFRGFANTYISIEDVNFLVGENSTGKTSVLGLLQTINNENFFQRGEFRGYRINFGSFSDIVSANAEDREYFRVGLGWTSPFSIPQKNSPEDHPAPAGMLLTYGKGNRHDLLPQIRAVTLSLGTTAISVLLQSAPSGQNGESVSLRYKIHEDQEARTLEELRNSTFPKWVKIHADTGNARAYRRVSSVLPTKGSISMYLTRVLHDVFQRRHSETLRRQPGDAELEDEATIRLLDFYSYARDAGDDSIWLAPIRTKPLRIYGDLAPEFSPGGEHTPYLLRRMLHPEIKRKGRKSFDGKLRSFGHNSGLFEAVTIKSHGEKVTDPFELDVVLDGKPLNLCTVGYGVSQSLPVLVEILTASKGSWFSIQQPEVHLHPRAQAAVGDTLFYTAVREAKRFLVETHSDFMIDRFRMNFREPRPETPESQILFFERKNKQNVVTPIRINKNGELSEDQPTTYREFFLNEEMRLLRIK